MLTNGTGNLMGTMLIHGMGSGPQAVISPGILMQANLSGNEASAIAVDAAANLYVADQFRDAVYQVQPQTGEYVVIAGQQGTIGYSGDGGSAVSATLSGPRGVAVDGAGEVFIADTNNNVVRKVDGSTRTISTVLGGSVSAAQLNSPQGLAIDSAGNLYVADTGNNMVRRLDRMTGAVTTVAGSGFNGYSGDGGAATSAALSGPKGLAIDAAGNLYIADSANNVIRKVDSGGTITTFAGNGIAASNGAPTPEGVPAISTSLAAPSALTVDASGSLYIAESGLVRRVDSGTLTIVTVAGSSASGYFPVSYGAPATSASLSPISIALDSSGSLYIGVFDSMVKVSEPAGALILPQTPPAFTSSTAVSRVFNSGNSSLTLSGLTVTGAFTLKPAGGSDCNSSTILSGGGECQIGVAATPTSSSSAIGSIALSDNALNSQATQQISLSSTGPGEQKVTVSSNYLNFGNVAIGNTSQKTVTLTNLGSTPAAIGSIAISESPSGFGVSNNCGTQIAVASACQVFVTFSPQSGSFFYANATISINDYAASSPQIVDLSGTVISPYSLTPGSLGFSARKVFTTSLAQVITITNTGSAPLSPPTPSLNGANYSEFALPGSNCPAQLAAGTSCAIPVTFTPSGNGTRTATLIFYSAAGGASNTIPLSGIGFGGQTRVKIDAPTPQTAPLFGLATFSGTAIADGNAVTKVLIAIDGVPYGTAGYNTIPAAGWSFSLDTNLLANGTHELEATALSSGGNTTATTAFTVANWAATPAMRLTIDNPGAQAGPLSGVVPIGGWAIDDNAAVTSVSVLVDGVNLGAAGYGGRRDDVCAAYPFRAGCPNVGWNFALNTASLSNGQHTLEVLANATSGETFNVTRTFSVAGNPMHIDIDSPGAAHTGEFSGTAMFGGWIVDDDEAIAQVQLSVDGVSYGNAGYGGNRPDVCGVFPNRAGCPNVGWGATIDTTSLSNGTHTLEVTGVTESGQSTTATTNFSVSNVTESSPFLITPISPGSQGGTYQGITTFTICTASPTPVYPFLTQLESVNMTIDGTAYGAATLNRDSSPSPCGAGSWTLQVDTTKLANGPHMLGVTAYGYSYGTPSYRAVSSTAAFPFSVANWTTANPTHITIDRPNTGSGVLRGALDIGGWAFNDYSTIQSIQVAVDGVALGNAGYGANRSDVCGVYPGRPGCPDVGWDYWLDTTFMADGTHTLAVTATSAAGQSSTVSSSFRVGNLPGSNIRISIDSPGAGDATGSVNFGGWALDGNDAIATVELRIDGSLIGDAAYGGLRSDVCGVYPGSSGCPNVGWNIGVDTTVLANGSHTAEVTATSTRGLHATVSKSFIVEN